LFVGLFCREGLGVASESECDVRNEVATPNFIYLCFPLSNLLGDYREFAVERTGVSEITAVRKVLWLLRGLVRLKRKTVASALVRDGFPEARGRTAWQGLRCEPLLIPEKDQLNTSDPALAPYPVLLLIPQEVGAFPVSNPTTSGIINTAIETYNSARRVGAASDFRAYPPREGNNILDTVAALW